MRNHLTVAGHNLTKYIVDETYEINAEDTYESWNDGNMVEHRVVTSQKIKGSFDICCTDQTGELSLSDFLSYWNSAVDNKVATLGLYVPALNEFVALECYYTIKSKKHIKKGDGTFIDILTITIKER